VAAGFAVSGAGVDYLGRGRTSRHAAKGGDMQPRTPAPSGTVEDAAALLNIGRTLAYQEAKAGRLPGVFRVGRLYRVSLPILYEHLGLPWPPRGHEPAGDDEPEAA
jgi:excisionase family DNA binding protein